MELTLSQITMVRVVSELVISEFMQYGLVKVTAMVRVKVWVSVRW